MRWPSCFGRTSWRDCAGQSASCAGQPASVLYHHHADPPFLLINSKTLQLNPAADVDVDLIQFLALTAGLAGTASAPPPVEACRQAVELHRGSLLAGFFVDGSPGFEEWLTVLRERLNRRLMRFAAI